MKSKATSRASASGDESGNEETEEKAGPSRDNDSSSSESLIEIRLNELVRKSEVSDFDLRALLVRCSACGSQINHYSYKEVKKHRKLGVINCRECYEFYGSSEFSQDESGYNYCTWCGNGGKLVVCDYCPNGFCSSCIRRNFGRAEISVTSREGWKCYCCSQKRLKPKVKFCDLVISMKEKSFRLKEKKPVPQNKTSVLEDWLQSAFDKCDEASKDFQRKMTKLKAISFKKQKSLKHIVKKMEEIINNHKTELKNVIASTSENYSLHLKEQLKLSQNSEVQLECITLDDDSLQPGQHEAGAKVSNASISIKLEEQHPSAEKIKDDIPKDDKPKDDTMQAKMLLLNSSSDSDNDVVTINSHEESPVDTKHQINEKKISEKSNIPNGVLSSDDSSSDEKETKKKKKKKSSSKIHPDSDMNANENVRRSLKFSSDSSEDNDFGDILQEIEKHIEATEDSKEAPEAEGKIIIDPLSDPKLKLDAKIDLFRCDHLLKDGQTTVKISDGSDLDERLDKLVDSLCKFPKQRKYSKAPTGKRRSGPFKVPAKERLLESSSSISLSSEDEEDQIETVPKKKILTKTKSPVKDSSSESSSDLSEVSDSVVKKASKKKSNAKSGKKAGGEDSSDDFLPTKKRKYDKLLDGPLLSDDEKKTKEKKNVKKTVRKRKVMSSDEEKQEKKEKSSNKSSTATSSSDQEDVKKSSKKRRRIKKGGTSSDDEDNVKESQENSAKKRKNIRKIVSQKKLAVTTKEAQQEEKERKRRIQERQRLYNQIVDTAPDGKEIITRKMVLEVDPESKAELVEIHPDLVCKLKPHQVNGVKFMWECCFETVKDLDKPGSGCILAHCMGLGKTLQVIAFLHTVLTNPIVNKKITRAMIICPYNVSLNWVTEFDYWLEDVEGEVKVHQLSIAKSNIEKYDIVNYWFEDGGVIIVSYDILRRLAGAKIPKLRKKEKARLQECLFDVGPDIVVCDEGHVLKNEKSATSISTSKLATRRRIVLTGTPLQNNLIEYHCMLSFVKPNLLGTVKEFRNRFVNPIINGQYDDSSELDVKLMKKRIHILHKLLDGCVQRCDYSALTKFLPPKHEFVISVKLSEVQVKMYECYLEKLTEANKGAKVVGKSLFVDFNNLRCIWTHPYICHVSHERAEYRKLFKDDDDEEFINDESYEEKSSSSSDGNSTSDDDKLVEKKRDYRTRSRKGIDAEEESEKEETEEKQWYHEFISEDDKRNIEISGKMVLLLEILKECERIGDKIILFSQSLLTLDLIEDMLEASASCTKKKDEDVIGSWTKGIDYFRMDGTTTVDFRKSYIDMFNDPSNERSRLFLISTRAGSLGTNLVGANRVIIFDTSWNPSHDVQAIFRVYRFGQIKPVYVYRLLAQGTMEEKIYDRQVTKLSLSCRVVDEQQIDRHFSAADLAALYSFDRNSTTQRPTPMVPKDRLLAELLIKSKDWIVTYHEHDSLLQNQTEEDLTEEERQAAWTEYENEKEGKGPMGMVFDVSSLNAEPDFSLDYEGKFMPDLKTLVEAVFASVKNETPQTTLEFKTKLLKHLYGIRQTLQEKHVKVLRVKQEYCSRGTVPNSVNKYMDEVSNLLKGITDYINKLLASATPSGQPQQQQRPPMRQPLRPQQQQRPFIFQQRVPGMQFTQQRAAYRFYTSAQVPAHLRAQFQAYTSKGPINMYAQNVRPTAAPVITEVDESVPDSMSRNSPKVVSSVSSSVTIEEIT